MSKHLTRLERETVITMNDEESWAEVFTHQRKVITKLDRNPLAKKTEEGMFGSTPWARYELPKNLVSFRAASAKGKERTPAQIAAAEKAAEVLRRNREAGA